MARSYGTGNTKKEDPKNKYCLCSVATERLIRYGAGSIEVADDKVRGFSTRKIIFLAGGSNY